MMSGMAKLLPITSRNIVGFGKNTDDKEIKFIDMNSQTMKK